MPIHIGQNLTQHSAKPFPWLALIIMSLATFLTISAEMLPTGLLPEMAREFGTGESAIGMLMSVFAFVVVLTSAPLTYLTRRLSRKQIMIAAVLTVSLGGLLTALAPSYTVLLVSRVVGGLGHGLFWSVVGAYPGYLVSGKMLGRAVAINSAGGSLAFVAGVPLGTWLGHLVGWSTSFLIVSGLMVVAAVAIWVFVPDVSSAGQQPARDQEKDVPSSTRSWFSDKTLFPALLLCTTAGAMMIGHYSFYTYISAFLSDPVGMSEVERAVMLGVYGAAGVVGLVLSGTLFAEHPRFWTLMSLSFAAIMYLVVGIFATQYLVMVLAISLLGVVMGALMPILQLQLLRTASTKVRDMTAAMFTTMTNVGIGGGALLGGILLDQLGVRATTLSAAILMLVAAGIIVLLRRLPTPDVLVP